MWKSFRIGSLFGIPIKLDVTFLLILPVFAYLIGVQVDLLVELLNGVLGAGIDVAAVTAGATPWILGLTAALGLFGGVVLHELGHSLTARRYGFPIESITLWLLGGIASFSEMPEDWRQEFAIAVAGPIVSVLVGVGSYALFVLAPELLGGAWLNGARFVFGYLAILNVALAAFNMLPAFPMDGRRVLRAFLARNRPYAKATQQAASVGKIFAVLMALFGLIPPFNVVLIGVAFFVYIAASGESQQVVMRAAFQDVTVADIMTPANRLHTVTPDTSVQELVERMFAERHTGYPVTEDDRLVGLVTLDDARDVKPVEREAFRVEEIMTTDLATVGPDEDVFDVIQRMQREGIGRLLVVNGGRSVDGGLEPATGLETTDRGLDAAGSRWDVPTGISEEGSLVGIITRSDVMTALNVIQESGALDPVRSPQTAD